MIIQQEHCKCLDFYWFRKVGIKGAVAGFLLSVMTVWPSYAQEDSSRDMIDLQNQVAQLKDQVSQLQSQSQNSFDSGDSDRHRKKRHVDSDSDSDKNAALLPDLVSRINNLEDQQRVMRGELDDLSNQLKTQNDLLNKKIDDMHFAAGHGDTKDSQPVNNTGAAGAASAPVVRKFSGNTENSGATLKDAQQALLKGDFQQAESIAKKVLSTSEGAQSVNAQFLLAQAQAGQGDFKASSLSYFAVYKKFPKSPKAPVALLGVGYSMMKNGRNTEACQALQLLHNKYPSVSSQIKSSAVKLSRKAKCS